MIKNRRQSVCRSTLSEGYAPCLTPGSQIWASHLGRCLTGAEMMAYQGIDLNEFPNWCTLRLNSYLTIKGSFNSFLNEVCLPRKSFVLFMVFCRCMLC